MANKDEKRVIYSTSDGGQYAFAVPDAVNRLDAVTTFISALEEAGHNPKDYHVLRVEGFAPSKIETIVKDHNDRFGGGL